MMTVKCKKECRAKFCVQPPRAEQQASAPGQGGSRVRGLKADGFLSHTQALTWLLRTRGEMWLLLRLPWSWGCEVNSEREKCLLCTVEKNALSHNTMLQSSLRSPGQGALWCRVCARGHRSWVAVRILESL